MIGDHVPCSARLVKVKCKTPPKSKLREHFWYAYWPTAVIGSTQVGVGDVSDDTEHCSARLVKVKVQNTSKVRATGAFLVCVLAYSGDRTDSGGGRR